MSFFYYTTRFSTQLKLVMENQWKFDEDYEVKKEYSGLSPTTSKVLSQIFTVLEKAPVYFMIQNRCLIS